MKFLKFVSACLCCLVVMILAGNLATSGMTQDARPKGLSPALKQQLIHIDTQQAARECGRQLGLSDDPAAHIKTSDLGPMYRCLAPKTAAIQEHYAR
jgi:hypothetical protein